MWSHPCSLFGITNKLSPLKLINIGTEDFRTMQDAKLIHINLSQWSQTLLNSLLLQYTGFIALEPGHSLNSCDIVTVG